jgi:hypothetical protein
MFFFIWIQILFCEMFALFMNQLLIIDLLLSPRESGLL